ncbi:DUF2225 domain-containing protein [Leptospira borgpetersenii]|uniref:PF09986 family protein n=1 Tax=Leptospira borgpetersenii serovar Pomona str. 200901868 TaxID=1192866 RepID=M6WES5_LEPBO|nr:DUF2225 domain-containing protein [Leptospira borgpetersenii]EMO60278.1 PF09986 family protein [Leptospira borgpetersenii serovar Pomona str. 200901868]MBE8363921.1 DUF2225 domain-containing protein [Leptospira borgpetersenii serovar Balcanica]MBE8367283.1 DUF2225 domain-containing protein [Leptospira borgpetersenii serovar Balcanica]MBE8401093.1 DUF2225 domain-containing protein [Leptospira borgpetersenii serovar Tarassovi]MBE8402782.1 DUF2225 domain-containing protein [Leptospira borgpete
MTASALAQGKKISFRAKEDTVCPICNEVHQKENMFQGGGRLIAGKLTIELRRLYEKNKKFGRVSPNDYVISVCPRCLYSSFSKDWSTLDGEENEKIRSQFETRRSNLEKILGPLDFYQDRNLVLGAASYLLAIECYQNRKVTVAPTPKKAVCAVRGAWYFDDLNNDFPNMGFDKVRDLLYQKSASWYTETMEIMQSGSEPVDQASYLLGPDTDKNWAFDGVIYLSAYLTMKFKDELAPDPATKLNLLVRAKRTLSRLYGSGKGSKSKPSVIIDMAKELYDEYNKLIEEMGGEK